MRMLHPLQAQKSVEKCRKLFMVAEHWKASASRHDPGIRFEFRGQRALISLLL